MTLLAVIYPAVYVVFTAVFAITQPRVRYPRPASDRDRHLHLDHYLLPEQP